MYKLIYNKELVCEGFCKEGVHKTIPSTHLTISRELKAYLMNLGNFKIKKDADLTKPFYTFSDKDMFEIVIIDYGKPKPSPTEILEEQHAQLLIENAMKDSQIAELTEGQASTLLDSASKDSEIEKLNQTVSELVLTVAQGGK